MVPSWAGAGEIERGSLSTVRALLNGYPPGFAYCALAVWTSPKNRGKVGCVFRWDCRGGMRDGSLSLRFACANRHTAVTVLVTSTA